MISFPSHVIKQYKYTLYLSQLLVSLALSEIWCILKAVWYHNFSPESYAPQTRTTVSLEFYFDVVRGAAEGGW
jgi:hypothetical protein